MRIVELGVDVIEHVGEKGHVGRFSVQETPKKPFERWLIWHKIHESEATT